MRIIVTGILFFGIALFSSCFIKISTRNAAVADEERAHCSIHKLKMHRTLVKIHYGKTCNYRNSKQLYPNAKKIVCGGCVVRPAKLAIIFYCKECNKIKQVREKAEKIEE